MKKYILLKPSLSIQLAHLYEHLFYMHLIKLLREKGLYLYSDYNFYGRTYYKGLIYIELEVFCESKLDFNKILQDLHIDFTEDNIAICISQIVAEKQSTLRGSSIEVLTNFLKKLHNEKWIKIDDYGIIDSKDNRQKPYPLFIPKNSGIKLKELKIAIKLAPDIVKNSHELVPLFRQFSHIIIDSLESIICDEYGLFFIKDSFKLNESASLKATLRIGTLDFELNDNLLQISKNLIQSMLNDGVFERCIQQLSSISYEKNINDLIDFENNHRETMFFVGSKGWEQIATMKNIKILLANSSIEFSLGKKKISCKTN